MAIAPFHRRVLPWIFILAFLAVTPIVLFYMAGYRWDAKKGRIERNSTVIVDSTPKGAEITIDGLLTSEVTPVTFETIDPGAHRFKLTSSGYHNWEKTFDVRSDVVTFANQIWLWKDAQPLLKIETSATRLALSPDGKNLLVFSREANITRISFYTGTLQLSTTSSIPTFLDPTRDIEWSDSGRYAVVYDLDTQPWLIDTSVTHAPLPLPNGLFRWEGARLVGNDGTDLVTIHPPQMDITRETLTAGLIDKSDTIDLRTATGTNHLVYVLANDPTRGLVLPEGNWSLYSHVSDYALLRSANSWLTLQDRSATPEYHIANGTMLREIPPTSIFSLGSKPLQRYLVINRDELWAWEPHTDPQLLTRQSEPIVQAAWHHEGNDIFYATKTGIYTLNTDPRDGYLVTQLASFDEVTDMAVNGGTIIIAGTKDGKMGLWTLQVE